MVASATASKTNDTVKRAAELETRQRKPLWQKAVPVIACQIVALLFVELVMAFSGLGEEEIFRFDRELGVCHIPNKHVTWRSEGYSQSWFNADGMREPGLTISKPPNTFRIALLGDSMTEGLQVPIDSTFGRLIEKRVGPLNGKRLQFLNFATSGYSTVQEYLQMKRQVFKYQPDLVVVCYNTRDMFENWAGPDQVITNVRPIAIHLPGGYLYVDQTGIARWWGSPRARFLLATSWLREHSHIYGLLTALELDWSQHNPWYRAFVFALAHPKKTRNDLAVAFAPANIGTTMRNMVTSMVPSAGGPTFQVKFFEDSQKNSATTVATAGAAQAPVNAPSKAAESHVFNSAASNEALSEQPEAAKTALSTVVANATNPAESHVFNSVASNEALSDQPEAAKAALSSVVATAKTAKPALVPAVQVSTPAGVATAEKVAPAKPNVYQQLITRTLTSLFTDMKNLCAAHNSKLAVISMPARAQLCPHSGLERTFAGMDYTQEIALLQDVCKNTNVGFFDCEAAAEQLPMKQRDEMYYTVHLTPNGQSFVADSVEPFLKNQLQQ